MIASSRPIAIVGSTARAAAMSARRAGFAPLAVDRFGDQDLRDVCEQNLLIEKLKEVPDRLRTFGPIPWMYTGPMENRPRLIQQLAETQPLLGNSATVVRAVRNPWHLAAVCREECIHFPEVRVLAECPKGDDWLIKPLRSAGGFGIHACSSQQTPARGCGCYAQRLVSGLPVGAVFVANGNEAVLLGVTQQLLGEPWLGAKHFQYCGSIGPIPLSPQSRRQLAHVGSRLACRLQLRGLFGVDAIVQHDEVWVIEINPRYTASVEILEHAFDISTIDGHVQACQGECLPAHEHRGPGDVFGKAVVFATRGTFVKADYQSSLLELRKTGEYPLVADIPVVGSAVPAGHPLVTVFARGASLDEALAQLREMADAVRTVRDRGTGRQATARSPYG